MDDITLVEGNNELNIVLEPVEPPALEWPRHRLYVLVLSEFKPYPDDYENTATVTLKGDSPSGPYTRTTSGYSIKRGILLYEGSINITATKGTLSGHTVVELLQDTHIELWIT